MSYSSNTIAEILHSATREIQNLKGTPLDILDVIKPPDLQYAQNLAQVIHKLSPLIGNMIEFSIASLLNKHVWPVDGTWIRQDPDFPDVLFVSELDPSPGIEIKTWFPLATEITARFKDSVSRFDDDHTYVVLIAWVPNYLIYGKPRIVDVWYDTARSLAEARDTHYHNPPDYLVLEPEDTRSRTRNLQQTNTNGYKFQGTPEEFQEAALAVDAWGAEGTHYSHLPTYQQQLRQLFGQYRYRLDTNFAKMDRIQHQGLETFKAQVLDTDYLGFSLAEWVKRLSSKQDNLQSALHGLLTHSNRGC